MTSLTLKSIALLAVMSAGTAFAQAPAAPAAVIQQSAASSALAVSPKPVMAATAPTDKQVSPTETAARTQIKDSTPVAPAASAANPKKPAAAAPIKKSMVEKTMKSAKKHATKHTKKHTKKHAKTHSKRHG